MILYYSYFWLFICSFVPYSYHTLMVAKYGNKREKFQVARGQAANEERLVREMERIMDVELFLRIQGRWTEDSPHRMGIIHKMFRHAAAKGRKEAGWIICQGCWQNLPQLNPEVGIPAVQLVGPETSKEELQELYLEVESPGTSHPQSRMTIFIRVLATPVDGQEAVKAPSCSISPLAQDEAIWCTSPPLGVKRSNRYMLVVTSSVGQLNLGPDSDNARGSPDSGNVFQNPQMLAVFS